MAERDVHTCLICQAEFADSLQFYEHVMEHGEDESEDEEVDNLPCQESSADHTDPFQSEGECVTGLDPYPRVPTVSQGNYFPTSPPLELSVSTPRLPFSYPTEPTASFSAHCLVRPQSLTAGIPFSFGYPHVPVSTPPPSPSGPTTPYFSVPYNYHRPTIPPPYAVSCIDLTQDETESLGIGRLHTKSISQQYVEMEAFTTHFKEQRIRMGYTQASVGVSMEKHYGIAFSQTTVSRFEAMQLNFHNLAKLKPLFEEWLEYEQQEITKSQQSRSSFRRRKKRTSFQPQSKVALESHFKRQPTPNSTEYAILADALGLDKEVVRIWFCNRRQKERKSKQGDSQLADSSQQLQLCVDDREVEMSSQQNRKTSADGPADITVEDP